MTTATVHIYQQHKESSPIQRIEITGEVVEVMGRKFIVRQDDDGYWHAFDVETKTSAGYAYSRREVEPVLQHKLELHKARIPELIEKANAQYANLEAKFKAQGKEQAVQ